MNLSCFDSLSGNNSVQYYDENIDAELEEMAQELADLENEGGQLDSLISENGLFK